MTPTDPAPLPAGGEPLSPPALIWHDDQPRAVAYDDIYHAADGAAETRRVFLEPAGLPQRWREQPRFTVAEIGFGTGLNLAVLMAAWYAQPGGRLAFISCEQHPLSHGQWQTLCERRARSLPGYRELAGCYPATVSGWHHRQLCGGQIDLHLYFGTAEAMLEELIRQHFRRVDAWWLDGFAPERNPELWSPELLGRLPKVSAPAATVTTFSAAGRVRRALAAAGFEMRRVDQRPHKRETLAGTLVRHAPAPIDSALADARDRAHRQGIQIVGAGIAGSALAEALVRAGLEATLFEAGAEPQGASTLPAAISHSRLLADATPAAAVRLAAQLYTDQWLKGWPDWKPTGIAQLALDEPALQKIRRIAERYAPTGSWLAPLDCREAQALLPDGAVLGGLHLREAGPLAGTALLRWLQTSSGVPCRWQHPIDERNPFAGVRIYASGIGLKALAPATYLELAGLGGQLDAVADARALAAPLVGGVYQIPSSTVSGYPAHRPQRTYLGTSYEYRPWPPQQATEHNLEGWHPAPEGTARYRSLRVASSDRLPVAGMLWASTNAALPGLWVSGGFGSHGFALAPLCAALLAGQLAEQPPVLTVAASDALSPHRFRLRQARRGYRHGAHG